LQSGASIPWRFHHFEDYGDQWLCHRVPSDTCIGMLSLGVTDLERKELYEGIQPDATLIEQGLTGS
jgi:hypothetical protein